MKDLTVNVLFRFSKKTGKIDTTITALGTGMLQMWALKNTTKTKTCMLFERDTGKLLITFVGTDSGFPTKKVAQNETCEDFGIPLKVLQSIKDDRFDK